MKTLIAAIVLSLVRKENTRDLRRISDDSSKKVVNIQMEKYTPGFF